MLRCSGSVQQLGFAYVEGVGITTEANYPYQACCAVCCVLRVVPWHVARWRRTARTQGVTGTCDTAKVKPVASITGFVTVLL